MKLAIIRYMKHIPAKGSNLLILQRGEELHQSLATFASEQNLNSAWLSGLGGADQLAIGFYDIQTKDYVWREYNQPLEILSLTGNLTIVDGKPFWHVHGVFSGTDFAAIGGHVKELQIGLTGEIHITPLGTAMSREYDATTGLKLICPAS